MRGLVSSEDGRDCKILFVHLRRHRIGRKGRFRSHWSHRESLSWMDRGGASQYLRGLLVVAGPNPKSLIG